MTEPGQGQLLGGARGLCFPGEQDRKAGIEPPAPKAIQGRRVIALDPRIADQVTLFIFDRKA